MSTTGRPILGKLYPIQEGMWNCLATEEEYRAEEDLYGHHLEVESRYSYTLTEVYRKAASLALRLADGDGNKTIALFEKLEKAIDEQGLEAGCADFTTQILTKKGKGQGNDLASEGPRSSNEDYLPPSDEDPDEDTSIVGIGAVDQLPEDF
jgi:hypothetical protein